jgi:hypothetical protein
MCSDHTALALLLTVLLLTPSLLALLLAVLIVAYSVSLHPVLIHVCMYFDMQLTSTAPCTPQPLISHPVDVSH